MRHRGRIFDFIYDPRYFIWLLAFIFIANFSDAYFTQKWIELKLAKELNPVMAYLLEEGPGLFVFVKMIIVSLALFILYLRRHSKLAQLLVWPTAILYLLVNVWHGINWVKIYLL